MKLLRWQNTYGKAFLSGFGIDDPKDIIYIFLVNLITILRSLFLVDLQLGNT